MQSDPARCQQQRRHRGRRRPQGADASERLIASQAFWVTVALAHHRRRDELDRSRTPSPTADNFFNITRNFAFIGIMALGMTAVIITGGIDLSVGSIMGLVGVVCGLLLQAEQHWVAGGRSPGSLDRRAWPAPSTAC